MTTRQEAWDHEYLAGKSLPTTHYRVLSAHTNFFERFLTERKISGKMLDIGCGDAKNAVFFAANGQFVYGVDISSQALSLANSEIVRSEQQSNIRLVQADICAGWPFRKSSFASALDATTLINVTGETEIANYLTELKRVLRPGGVFQIVTPILPDEFYAKLVAEQNCKTIQHGNGIVQRVYSLEELLNLLKISFSIEAVDVVRKENKMYGQTYKRVHARIIGVNYARS